MPAAMPPALPLVPPPQAVVQVTKDSANDAERPYVDMQSHGYTYEVFGEPQLDSELLREILWDTDDPAAALLAINIALQKEYPNAATAVITQNEGDKVVIRVSRRLKAPLQGKAGGSPSTSSEPQKGRGSPQAAADEVKKSAGPLLMNGAQGPAGEVAATPPSGGAAPGPAASPTSPTRVLSAPLVSTVPPPTPPASATPSPPAPAVSMAPVASTPSAAALSESAPIVPSASIPPPPSVTTPAVASPAAPAAGGTEAVDATPAIANIESHGYDYEIIGQPLLTHDELRLILVDAANPADAVARLNKVLAEHDLALASAHAEYSEGISSRILRLRQVAALEAKARTEPYVPGASDIGLKVSTVLDEARLAKAYAAMYKDSTTVRIRLLKQPVAKLDAPEALKPFFSDVTDVNLSLSTLLTESAMANAYAARQGMRTQMSFAAIPGSEALRMSVDEQHNYSAKPWNASLSIGNLGNRYAGRWQAQTSLAFRPGYGSELTANYAQGLPALDSASKGSSYRSGGLGASSVTPWGVYGLSYSQTNYDSTKSVSSLVIGNPPQLVELEEQQHGSIKSLAISGEQILHSTQNTRWTASEGLAHVDDTASIDAEILGVLQENVPLYDEKYNALSAGISLTSTPTVMGRDAVLMGSLKFAKGLSGQVGAFPLSVAHLADPRFFLVQGSASYDQTLPMSLKFGASLGGQWTNNIVPHSRQLVVGGFGNLTAWLPGVASGDRGALFRTTLSSPAVRDGAGTFTVSLFYEASRIAIVNGDDLRPTQSLSDLGIGLVGDTPYLQYMLGYAEPLVTGNTDDAVIQPLRAHTFFNLTGKW